MDRRTCVYHAAVRKHFAFLKRTTSLDDLYAKSIRVGSQGYLLPVAELHTQDAVLIGLLSRWRDENAFAFPSRFPVTDAGTAAWLRSKLLDVEDRILFLIVDAVGRPIGHAGFANCLNERRDMQLDNVMRGVRDVSPGLMGQAVQALLDWAIDVCGPDSFSLRVMHDNERAIAFERKLGFVDAERIPLKRRVEGEATFFDEMAEGSGPADHYYLRMTYAPARAFTPRGTILTAGPTISGLETSYVLDAVRTGWNANWHGYLGRLEEAVAEYFGVKHALSTSSCTGALHLALLGLGIGPGDEVIVPDATWVATANAVAYTGATPVFVDVEPDSWCMDPVSFAAAITGRTKAVMPVHLYGHPARMDEIMRVAEAHDLAVLEDGAPAIGAECRGIKAGTFGDVAAFSFQGAKLAVAGEGGILVTNDSELYERIHSLWDQGRDPSRAFWIDRTGWKYKMSNLQAALALAQIERVEELIEAKRRIFQWYVEGLDGVAHVTLNQETPWARSIYWMTSLIVGETTPISRDDLRDALKRRGIDTRPVFPAISQYPVWERPQPPQPIARRLGDRGINLPSGHRLRREEVAYICDALRSELGSATA